MTVTGHSRSCAIVTGYRISTAAVSAFPSFGAVSDHQRGKLTANHTAGRYSLQNITDLCLDFLKHVDKRVLTSA